MKRIVQIIISLGLLTLFYQIVISFFINSHEVNYSVKLEDNSFIINEKFVKEKNKHTYDFFVTDENKEQFVFSTSKDFGKRKEVIKKIEYFEEKNLKCILPIYKNKETGEIICKYDGELVNYNYLKSNNISINKFISKLKKDRYNNSSWSDKESNSKKYNMDNSSVFYIYEENLLKDYTFAFWNYNGLFLVGRDKIKNNVYYEKDLYDNSNSTIVGKYYFIFNFENSNSTIIDIDYINLEDYGKTTMTFPGQLSENMYINGVYKNKLYVTDLSSRIQFSLDPYKQEIKEVGNSNDGYFVVVDNNEKVIEEREYFKNKYYFKDEVEVKELDEKYKNIDIVEDGNYYYFKDDKNNFYKVNKEHLELPMKLFSFDSVSEWKVNDDDILIVSDDTMYFYTEDSGLVKIAKNKEFKFNYKNICNFYKKS